MILSVPLAYFVVSQVTDRMKLLKLRFFFLRREWKQLIEKSRPNSRIEWTSSAPVVMKRGDHPILLKEFILSASIDVTFKGETSKAHLSSNGFGLAVPDRRRGWRPTGVFIPEVDSAEAALAKLKELSALGADE
jgi:hypothetical protein